MALVRKLTGLKAACASCCAPGDSLLIAGSEEGQLCSFDLTSGQLVCSVQLDPSGQAAVGSLCTQPHPQQQQQQQVVYAAVSDSLHVVDLRAGLSPVTSHPQCCHDEINQVCINAKATHLATADDSGTIQVLDLAAGRVFKRMHGAHTNMATCVAFRPHRPWELVTGGMDMTVARWDYSRGKCLDRLTLTAAGGTQMFNPPYVHALAVPDVPSGCRPWCQALAVACGDGGVMVLDADQGLEAPGAAVQGAQAGGVQGSGPEAGGGLDEATAPPSPQDPTPGGKGAGGKRSPAGSGGKPQSQRGGRQQALSPGAAQGSGSPAAGSGLPGGNAARAVNPWVVPKLWDQQCGGHTRPAACLAYSWAGVGGEGQQGPRYLVSGGEDRRVLVWDLKCDVGEGGGSSSSRAGAGGQPGSSSGQAGTGEGAGGAVPDLEGLSLEQGVEDDDDKSSGSAFRVEVRHGRKVNCLAAGRGTSQQLLVVGDTSKRMCVYDLSSELQ